MILNFIARIFDIYGNGNGVLTAFSSLVIAWLVPRETAAVLVHVLCTAFNHAPVQYSVASFKAA